MITCTTPSKDWRHPHPGRVNKGAAKYRTTRRVCSIDKLSFVPRCFPHIWLLSILGSTPDRDRCASARLDFSRRLPWDVHDTHATDATYTWWWLCELICQPPSRHFRRQPGHLQVHCTSKPAEPPTSSGRARFVASPMRQNLTETKR